MADKRKKGSFKKQLWAWALIAPLIVVLYLAVWRPTVIGAFWSFFKMNAYNPGKFVGLENYRLVLANSQFIPILKNTLMYVFWSLVIGFIPPLAIAIMVNEMVHFKKQIRIITYLPAVIPGIAAMLIWMRMYDPSSSGLLNMILQQLGLAPYGWLDNPNFTIIGIVIYMTWSGFPVKLLQLKSNTNVQINTYFMCMVFASVPTFLIFALFQKHIMGGVNVGGVKE